MNSFQESSFLTHFPCDCGKGLQPVSEEAGPVSGVGEDHAYWPISQRVSSCCSSLLSPELIVLVKQHSGLFQLADCSTPPSLHPSLYTLTSTPVLVTHLSLFLVVSLTLPNLTSVPGIVLGRFTPRPSQQSSSLPLASQTTYYKSEFRSVLCMFSFH